MPSDTAPTFEDLILAYEWVSADPNGQNEAYVSRETGRIYWITDAIEPEEELPEDLEDGTKYLAIPHQRELDLGSALALKFVREVLPGEYHDAVAIFQNRGAYRKFKAMLERERKLEAWYEYENNAVTNALQEWVSENKLPIPLAHGKGVV